MISRLPLHPFLVGAYPILLVYAINAGEVSVGDLGLVLGATFLLAALATAAAWASLRDLRKAAIAGSLFMFLFFFYRWDNQGIGDSGFIRHGAWLNIAVAVVSLTVLTTVFILLRRERSPLHLANLTRVLNAVGLFLVLTSLLPLVRHARAWAAAPLSDRKPAAGAKLDVQRPGALGYYPDIYFILLDQYPRADMLWNNLFYDNQPFLNELRKLKFFVAENSASNYPRTIMSVASTLNLDYLDAVMGEIDENSTDLNLPSRAILHNRVFQFLRERGYHTIVFPPEYEMTRIANADEYLDANARVSEFTKTVIGMTPIEDLLETFHAPYSVAEIHRRNVLYTLDTLAELPHREQSPKFVYAHILCPHPPIVFGANGERVHLEDISQMQRLWVQNPALRQDYLNQLTFISKKALEAVKAILAHSPRPPVIILCSDHGTEFEVDWRHPESSNLKERMANLACFYFPGGGVRLLNHSITNVNFFRLIFRYYLGGDFDRLPDRSYFSPDATPYQFILVPMTVPAAPAK